MATKRRREEKEEEGKGTLGSLEEKEYQAYINSMCAEDLSDELLFSMPEFRSKVWLHNLLEKGKNEEEIFDMSRFDLCSSLGHEHKDYKLPYEKIYEADENVIP